jgi:hypothetical protein
MIPHWTKLRFTDLQILAVNMTPCTKHSWQQSQKTDRPLRFCRINKIATNTASFSEVKRVKLETGVDGFYYDIISTLLL